jgi:hypothetical protein
VVYKDGIGYFQLQAGVYTLTVSLTGGGDPLLLVFELDSGDIGDIFMAGNGTNQSLTAQSVGVQELSGTDKIYLPIIVKND